LFSERLLHADPGLLRDAVSATVAFQSVDLVSVTDKSLEAKPLFHLPQAIGLRALRKTQLPLPL